MISVIIPTIDDPHIERTIKSVFDNVYGEAIEIIVVVDGGEPIIKTREGWPKAAFGATVITHPETLGRRVSINEAARIARGSHLFILDAHCSMSEGWDKKLLEACKDNTIVVCTFQDMDPETWNLRPGLYHHCYLNTKYTEKWWHKAEQPIEEMMCFTGCAWLIPKDYYWKLGGYDESLGNYGWDGPEWSLKVWLNDEYPGRVLLRSDVICGHIFGTNDGSKLYVPQTIGVDNWIKYATDKWGQKIQTLVDKFNPPDWKKKEECQCGAIDGGRISVYCPIHNKGEIEPTKEPEMKKDEKIVFHTTINKVDNCVDKDKSGNVVRTYRKIFKPFVVDHDGSKSEAEIAEIATPQITEVEREEECAMSS